MAGPTTVLSTNGGGSTGRTTTKRILASLSAAAVLATGAVALTSASASAASGCWGDAGQKSFGGTTCTARYCHNYLGDVVGFYSSDDTGYLYEPFPGLSIC
ncbi:hypothetical protein [Streptomyces galbus]|uniref:hypothetical protein n=1 Tax=Streptomyces galbus TaxID=33898 RepID=UPI0019B398C8|nr:hypothetical protein [Streptomyces galbus]GHD42166.1 hypothetical protein GCM10010335_44720 [Streptomyces galbus]